MFWKIADFLERKGYITGIVLVALPIIYDIVGLFYGRDLRIKVETAGVWVQITGLIIIGLARYARRWGKK